jgi:quercetin dioxygenase-like cupin family protein
MKLSIVFLVGAFFAASALVMGADPVTFVGHEKVNAALKKGTTLVEAKDLLVSGSYRDKAGQVEVHEKETDVIHVLEGTATFVTGGKMLGGKQTKPGQMLGTEIEGGETHKLVKGDVIVVPAGNPHWFKEVPATGVSYYVVKVLKQ